MDILQRLRGPQAVPGEGERLLEDLREVRRQLEAVRSYFALETDEDLLEAAIYQREALEARHRYLLRLARRQGAAVLTVPLMDEDERWIN